MELAQDETQQRRFARSISADKSYSMSFRDRGGSVLDSPAIVNGTLFWGSGYRRIRPGKGNNKLYAFGLP